MVTMSTATDLNDGRVGGMRVPPHNLQAEESLLGAMLLRSQAIADAVETVVASDFYKPAHGHIFEAITSLYGGGEPVDPVTVSEELKRAGLLSAIGGSGVLLTIQSRTPAVSNVPHYADRRGELAAPQAHHHCGGDRRARLLTARRHRQDRRSRRNDGLRCRSASHHGLDGRAPGTSGPEPRSARGALRAQGVHHRHPVGLPRSRPTPVGVPTQLADHRGRPALHGQDGLRPERSRQRR